MNEQFRRLDQLRREKGISLKKMGEICGITPQGVQTWKNAAEIPVRHIATLATYFGVTTDSLLAQTASPGFGPVKDQPQAAYGAKTHEACRYPQDCDLPKQLDSLRVELDDIRRLLVSLLAEERHRNTGDGKRKAV